MEGSHSTPEAVESAGNIVQVEVLVHQSADPVGVVTNSQSAGGVAHDRENSAQHINIDFESPNKSVLNTSKDPMVSQTFSDLDAAEILAALNEDRVEITQTESVVSIIESNSESSWSSPWNVELENIFKLPPVVPKPKKTNCRRLTSHRLLTSPEIINEKRKAKEEIKKVKKAKK